MPAPTPTSTAQTTASAVTPKPNLFQQIGSTLKSALVTVRHGGILLISMLIAVSILLLLIVSPLVSWIFREALRANGMVALDLGSFSIGPGFAISILLLFLLTALAFITLTLSYAVIVEMLWRAQNGESGLAGMFGHTLRSVFKKLVKPSALPLLAYLFVLLPLTGFGFLSVLTQGISVPQFISGELLKSPTGAAAWLILNLVMLLLGIRFALTIPIFSVTNANGAQALRASWSITGFRTSLVIVGSVLIISLAASVISALVAGLLIVPTAIFDAVSPDLSPVVAAISLAVGIVLGGAVTALTVALISAALVNVASGAIRSAAPRTTAAALQTIPNLNIPASEGSRSRGEQIFIWATAGIALVTTVALSISGIDAMTRVATQPDTLVLAHRGFVDGGVENTIGALEAAATAGADLVEMDVMQTKDGKFVVMHDGNLSRLAGQDLLVKNLTLAELTDIFVTDEFGHREKIPSLEAYLLRAQELELPLLIEYKLGGADTEDGVERLAAELVELGLLTDNIYHSLDYSAVEKLKSLHPDVTVGYIMSIAAEGLPKTSADFLVVEGWSATQQMQVQAHDAGLGFFTWTINEEPGMLEMLRRNVDGIITDHPDQAIALREQLGSETGLAPILMDLLRRFIIFI